MKHSETHYGLQCHSLGALYPFSVVITERHENGAFYGACLIRNLVTGIAYGRFPFLDYDASFDVAHRDAEKHAASLLADEKRALRNRQWWRQALAVTPDYAKNALVIAAVGATSIVATMLADDAAKHDAPIVASVFAAAKSVDANYLLRHGYRIFDPEGYEIGKVDGPQDARELLEVGFTILDPNGKRVDRL